MRILHVTAQRPDSTGSGVYLRETVAVLGQAGHEQAVVAGVGPEGESPFASDVLFAPVRFETPGLPFPVVGMSDVMPYRATRYRDLTPQMTAQFKAAFEHAFDQVLPSFSPDVVICHHLYLVCGVLMDWFSRHADVRAACSVRGISHNTDIRQFCSHGLERDFIARGVRALDFSCALHESQAREIVEVYGIDVTRVRVTGTGYNVNVFCPAPKSSGPAGAQTGTTQGQSDGGVDAEKDTRLLYVGKLWKQKGLMQLMGALDLLPSDFAQRIRLDMVGGYSDEVERDEIVACARQCQVPVRFLGALGQKELVEAYREADVFVLPSFSEGLPLVVVEALACGCNVVMTDLPGVREWFSRYVPDAPIRYVALPNLAGDAANSGDAADFHAFEQALADTIAASASSPPQACDLSELSWEALSKRLIA